MSRLRHQQASPTNGATRASEARDEGSALILALVLILVGTMMVIPVMRYTMTVTRANRVASSKSERVEAVKAGLRVALYDPAALYQACTGTGPTSSGDLAVPPGLNIVSTCNAMSLQNQNLPTEQRYALTVVQAGADVPIPAPYVAQPGDDPLLDATLSPTWCTSLIVTASNPVKVPCGREFPGNGNTADTHAWGTSTSKTVATNTIFTPALPPYANSLPRSGGYDVPGDTPCKAFFPGRYPDDVTISGSTPIYFVSGIYYFEKMLRITGNATVVVGAGAVPGCVESDAVAVADAIDAPYDISSSGVGGTFVFGAAGRLVVDTGVASAAPGMSLSFNRRLVEESDQLAKLNDISIMSVNGELDPLTGNTTIDLERAGQLHVPTSPVLNGSTEDPDPLAHGYKSSTLISTPTAPTTCAPPIAASAACPIVDINLTSTAKVNLVIPGYVAVPQGSVSVTTTAGSSVNKKIAFGGGLLAAQLSVVGELPVWLQLGLLNPVVQKTFKITTTTSSGTPFVVSTALVQVNETGGYAVNSWVVQAE